MQGRALKNTRLSTPTEHESLVTNYLRFVHSEPSVITNFVGLSHLLTVLAYIFINAFWEELATYPTNASTRRAQNIEQDIFQQRDHSIQTEAQ